MFNTLFGTQEGNITVIELKEKMKTDQDAFYVDVRTPGEFSMNGLQQFTNIPLDQVPARLSEFPKDREIVVICQSGGRSRSAFSFLKQNGFTNVTNVSGGMGAWMMQRL